MQGMEARCVLQTNEKAWSPEQAEAHFRELLNIARSGRVQRIVEPGGSFTIQYERMSSRVRAGEVLARGGPVDDEGDGL